LWLETEREQNCLRTCCQEVTPIVGKTKRSKKKKEDENNEDAEASSGEDEDSISDAQSGYDYLLSMPLWSLTHGKGLLLFLVVLY